jgi:hypothetical protein
MLLLLLFIVLVIIPRRLLRLRLLLLHGRVRVWTYAEARSTQCRSCTRVLLLLLLLLWLLVVLLRRLTTEANGCSVMRPTRKAAAAAGEIATNAARPERGAEARSTWSEHRPPSTAAAAIRRRWDVPVGAGAEGAREGRNESATGGVRRLLKLLLMLLVELRVASTTATKLRWLLPLLLPPSNAPACRGAAGTTGGTMHRPHGTFTRQRLGVGLLPLLHDWRGGRGSNVHRAEHFAPVRVLHPQQRFPHERVHHRSDASA